MKKGAQYLWYSQNMLKLAVVCVRVFSHCVFHPRKFFDLFFNFFSTLNEFYQNTHGRLHDFAKTETSRKMHNDIILAATNYHRVDPKIARSGETQVLATLVKYLQPRQVFEIGTYNGFTTLHFAANTVHEAVIHTLDLPENFGLDEQTKKDLTQYSYDDMLVVELSRANIHQRLYQQTPYRNKIRELYGDSLKFDFSPYYCKMDLVFIDGSHAYPYVKSDTENALKMLSANGIILWHDYDYIIHRDVFKYLNKLVETYRIYSIPFTRFAIYGPHLK